MLLGHAVAQLVEALRYKPKGCRFDSHWCQWNFSLAQSYGPHYGHAVHSASNRNEHQQYILGGKGSRCVGLTTLPPAHANFLEMWEPQPPGTHRPCTGIALHLQVWCLLCCKFSSNCMDIFTKLFVQDDIAH